MNTANNKSIKRDRRRAKIRAKISGTHDVPRLSVFKSNKGMFAQLIDDNTGTTIASAKDKDPKKLGESLAKAALAKKIDKAVFDRGGYVYTGRVKALADSAREAGLKF